MTAVPGHDDPDTRRQPRGCYEVARHMSRSLYHPETAISEEVHGVLEWSEWDPRSLELLAFFKSCRIIEDPTIPLSRRIFQMSRLTVLKCPRTKEGRSSGKVFPEWPTMVPVRMARSISVVLLELEAFIPEDDGAKFVQCQSVTFDDLLSY